METVEANTPNDRIPQLASRKSTLRFLVRAAIGIVLLGLIAAFVDVRKILSAFSEANTLWMILGFLLVIPNISLQAAKWKYMVSVIKPEIGWGQSFRSLVFGITLGSFTPGQIGELGGRALSLETDTPGTIVGLTTLDKFQMLLVLATGGIWSTVYFVGLEPRVGIVVSVFITLACVTLFFIPRLVQKVLQIVGIQRLRNKLLHEMLEAFSIMRPRQLLVAFLLTISIYLLLFVQFYILFMSFVEADVADIFLGFSALMFYKALIPISIGDLGIREAGSVYFFSLLGMSEAVAFNAAILLSACNIFLPALVGIFFIPRHNVFRKRNQSSEETVNP